MPTNTSPEDGGGHDVDGAQVGHGGQEQGHGHQEHAVDQDLAGRPLEGGHGREHGHAGRLVVVLVLEGQRPEVRRGPYEDDGEHDHGGPRQAGRSPRPSPPGRAPLRRLRRSRCSGCRCASATACRRRRRTRWPRRPGRPRAGSPTPTARCKCARRGRDRSTPGSAGKAEFPVVTRELAVKKARWRIDRIRHRVKGDVDRVRAQYRISPFRLRVH